MNGSRGIILSDSNPAISRHKRKVKKMKKIDILPVTLEVEYKNPILGRLFASFAWLMLVRFKKFNLTMNNRTVCSFYRLIVPRFVKGGGVVEE